MLELTLPQLLGEPLPPGVQPLREPGLDAEAFSFEPAGDTGGGQPAHPHLPDGFPPDFALLLRVRPAAGGAGMLLALTDGAQATVSLGLKLDAVRHDRQDLLLLLAPPGTPRPPQPAARFPLPPLAGRWTRLALGVQGRMATLYLDCRPAQRAVLEREPRALPLEPGAGLFVGQAGAADPDKFQVRGGHCRRGLWRGGSGDWGHWHGGYRPAGPGGSCPG